MFLLSIRATIIHHDKDVNVNIGTRPHFFEDERTFLFDDENAMWIYCLRRIRIIICRH